MASTVMSGAPRATFGRFRRAPRRWCPAAASAGSPAPRFRAPAAHRRCSRRFSRRVRRANQVQRGAASNHADLDLAVAFDPRCRIAREQAHAEFPPHDFAPGTMRWSPRRRSRGFAEPPRGARADRRPPTAGVFPKRVGFRTARGTPQRRQGHSVTVSAAPRRNADARGER